jgi:hypothetical protein
VNYQEDHEPGDTATRLSKSPNFEMMMEITARLAEATMPVDAHVNSSDPPLRPFEKTGFIETAEPVEDDAEAKSSSFSAVGFFSW